MCGQVAHVYDGKLLFWNGHMIEKKMKSNINLEEKDLLNFEGYVFDDGKCQWSQYLSCLNVQKKKLIHLTSKEQNTYNEIMEREKKNHYIIV